MLDSSLEPSYNLTKNLLYLPWILKLIVDMVNASTSLDITKICDILMTEKNILKLFLLKKIV